MSTHTFAQHLTVALRTTIERRVSDHLARSWQIETVIDKVDESSHPAALLSDGSTIVFVKIYQGELAEDQLQREVAGLRLLQKEAGVLTPVIIDRIPHADDVLILMEAVTEIPRTPADWRRYGQALAQIHTVTGPYFGLDAHSYWGSLYQDNRPLANWPAFFWQRRIEPRLRASYGSGNLPAALASQVERIGTNLAQLCGQSVQPTLLHGDAHQNNVINTAAGPVFIDPAVYYGHPEMDLALIDFFAPVAPELYEGYAEVRPIAADFAERKPLWLLPAWLAMVELDGPQHLAALRAVVERY